MLDMLFVRRSLMHVRIDDVEVCLLMLKCHFPKSSYRSIPITPEPTPPLNNPSHMLTSHHHHHHHQHIIIISNVRYTVETYEISIICALNSGLHGIWEQYDFMLKRRITHNKYINVCLVAFRWALFHIIRRKMLLPLAVDWITNVEERERESTINIYFGASCQHGPIMCNSSHLYMVRLSAWCR